jgi:hypothetical protein
VKRAAQAARLGAAKSEVGTAMRAIAIHQPVFSIAVAEQHEVFAQQAHGPDRPRARKLLCERRRLPVHAHKPARGRAGPDAREEVILLLAHHRAFSSPALAPVIACWRAIR